MKAGPEEKKGGKARHGTAGGAGPKTPENVTQTMVVDNIQSIPYYIWGYVYAPWGEPIEGISIYIKDHKENPKYRIITDPNGYFSVKNPDPGKYKIVVKPPDGEDLAELSIRYLYECLDGIEKKAVVKNYGT